MSTALATISERISVKKFMVNNGFTAFFKSVRENANGLPYVTFLRRMPDGSNEGENIYFSRNTSAEVALGTDVVTLFKGGKVKMAEVSYSDGRPSRWKIVSANQNDDYVSIDDLD